MYAYERPRLATRGRSAPPGPFTKALRILVGALSILYPVTLAGIVAAFHYVGEKWWSTGVALYLPRIGFGLPLPILVVALAAVGMHRLLWTQLVALVVLVVPLMGLTWQMPGAAHPKGPSLRVLSYNINSANGGTDRIAEEIERYSPDVVLLQEVGRSEPMAQMLRPRFATVQTSTQFLIATRFAILSTVDPGKVPYEGRTRAARFMSYVLDTPLGHIVVYNIHPVSPRSGLSALRGDGLLQKLASGHGLTSSDYGPFLDETGLRILQVEDVATAASRETLPVIVAGDTNLPDLSPVLDRFSRYRDGFKGVGSGFGYTFPVDRDRQPWMRIDRVFASPALRFIHFDVGHSRASDHLCVVADLDLAPQ
jgi:endonuclease/exonuclease/phosphatase (EEP) superfamily protein YafD